MCLFQRNRRRIVPHFLPRHPLNVIVVDHLDLVFGLSDLFIFSSQLHQLSGFIAAESLSFRPAASNLLTFPYTVNK